MTRSACAVKVRRWQAGLSTWLNGAVTTGTLRTTSTRSSLARWMSSPRSTAFGACLGTVDNSTVLPAFCRPGQSGGGLARHGDVQFGGHISDQRCLDAVERAVLRPVQLGGGLVDRQHRGGDRQQGPEQTGDDRDEAGDPVSLLPAPLTELDASSSTASGWGFGGHQRARPPACGWPARTGRRFARRSAGRRTGPPADRRCSDGRWAGWDRRPRPAAGCRCSSAPRRIRNTVGGGQGERVQRVDELVGAS